MELDTMFDISAQTRAAMPEVLTLPGTVDPHVHFRLKKTGQMAMVAAECATEHEATVDIPNVPGITSLEALRERYADIHSCIPYGQRTQVLMTPLVNDTTDPEFIRAARKARLIHGVKIFWQGVSNDYGNSISSAAGAEKLIRSLGDTVCTLHAECRDDYDGKRIPIKNREFWCVENEVSKIIKMNPEGTFVIRHISDRRTLQWIETQRGRGFNIHGELSPQYLILIDDDIFTGEDSHAALQCNCVFWPRPKDKHSQDAIRRAALWGVDWLHIGTDYAMHLEDFSQPSGVKINNKGVAVGGLNFLPRVAKSVLIDFYISHGRKDLLAPMLSGNAAKLYGIMLSDKQYKYMREDWVVPDYSMGKKEGVIPGQWHPVRSSCFLRGHTMHWRKAT